MSGKTLRLAVLGDSVAWGQGLLPENKFSTLVAQGLEASRDCRVEVTCLAHSGAKIGMIPLLNEGATSQPGEIPLDRPTINQQVNQLPPGSADLILLTGGINDVNVRTILNPLTSTDALKKLVEQQCYQAMQRLLLDLTDPASGCPDADIVVLGYYPILSASSEVRKVEAFCDALGLALAGLPGALASEVLAGFALADIEGQCLTFAQESSLQLARAVSEVASLRSGRGSLRFVDPRFGLENAALSPRSWLWGLDGEFNAEDPVAASRRPVCDDLLPPGWDREFCHRASAGHPNVLGAQAYAKAILTVVN